MFSNKREENKRNIYICRFICLKLLLLPNRKHYKEVKIGLPGLKSKQCKYLKIVTSIQMLETHWGRWRNPFKRRPSQLTYRLMLFFFHYSVQSALFHTLLCRSETDNWNERTQTKYAIFHKVALNLLEKGIILSLREHEITSADSPKRRTGFPDRVLFPLGNLQDPGSCPQPLGQ